METVRNNLPQHMNLYFNKLSTYLDTKLYFFGSVQRLDYLENESDIDIAIFTDNMEPMLLKIQNLLKSLFQKKQAKTKFILGIKLFMKEMI